MNTTSTITYDAMLALFAQGRTTPFRIGYVVSQGKSKGQIREYILYPGAPKPKKIQPSRENAPTTRTATTYKDRANMLFTQFGTMNLIELFSYNIITLDGKQVVS